MLVKVLEVVGSKSTGFAFENEITKDIETYIEEGETSENFKCRFYERIS